MDFLSPNKGDNQQSRVEERSTSISCRNLHQLFAQKGPISDLALFSTETDSLSLFVEIPSIVLANTSNIPFNKSFISIPYWVGSEIEICFVQTFFPKLVVVVLCCSKT